MAFLQHRANACHDTEAQEQRGDIRAESRAARAEIDSTGTFAAGAAWRNRAVSRPQVPEQQRNLFVRKPENVVRKAFFVRPLVEDAQPAKPPIHAFGSPAVAVPADEQ